MSQRAGISPSPTGAQPPLAWQWADLAAAAALALAVLLLSLELFKPGVQNVGDMLMSVYRVFELHAAWERGVLYPRLGPNLNFGLGAPLFQYYPPLASYLALAFHALGLGYIAATKAVMALSLLLGGLGIYGYLRWLTGRRLGAVVAALLFLISPYLLLVTFERGAVAEGLALALLPWLLWSSHRLQVARHFWAVGLAAVLVALLLMAHNITALFVLPAVLIYCAAPALAARNYAGLARTGAAFLLGLGLSAFYWLPALGELHFSRAETMMLGGNTDVLTWLVGAPDLVQRSLQAVYAGDVRFQFGLLMFLYGSLGVVTVPWQDRRLRLHAALLAGGWVAVLLLQLTAAAPFWQHAPLARFIQFPWRLYGLATVCTVLLLGLLLNSARAAALPRALRLTAAAALVVAGGLAHLPAARVAALPLWTEMREEKIVLRNLFARGQEQFPLFTDYTPAAMTIYGSAITQPRPPGQIVRAEAAPAPAITIARLAGSGFDLTVDTPTPFTLKAPRTYFGGWQIYVDGAPVATFPSGPLGLVAAEIPAGAHHVQVAFTQTPLRAAADAISLLALALLVFGMGAEGLQQLARRKQWPAGRQARWVLGGAGVLAVAVTGGLLLGAQQWRSAATTTPVAYGANLDDEVQLLAYQIENPAVAGGEELRVNLYWYVQKTPVDDRKVFIHVNYADDSGRVAQNDQAPLLGYYPTTQWEEGQIFADEYHVEIPPDAPEGRYVVTVGMYHPDPPQNLRVLGGPNTWPGDRMVLGEVEIRHGR